jgi:deoxyhypusine synthase
MIDWKLKNDTSV